MPEHEHEHTSPLEAFSCHCVAEYLGLTDAECCTALAEAQKAERGQPHGEFPDGILELIAAVMEAVQQLLLLCPQSRGQLLQTVRQPSLRNSVAFTGQLRTRLGRYSRQAGELARCCRECCREADNATLAAVYDDALQIYVLV